MRNQLISAICAILALGLAPACSSESDPGESCDTPGGTKDVCASGTVCGRPSEKSNAIVCIAICGDDKDCLPGDECKGVEGTSIKGCRFKD